MFPDLARVAAALCRPARARRPRRRPPPFPRLGPLAPDFCLPDERGHATPLPTRQGQPVLLIFLRHLA